MKNSIKSVDRFKIDAGTIARLSRDSRTANVNQSPIGETKGQSNRLSNSFLSERSKTHVPPTPALGIPTPVPEEGDKRIFIEPTTPATPEAIHAISREIVRSQFELLLSNFSDPAFDAEAQISHLRAELEQLQIEVRDRDLSRPVRVAREVAAKIGEQAVNPMDAGAARQFATTLKATWKAELTVLEDFEDPLTVATGLFERFQIVPKDGRIPPFVSISNAVEIAKQGKTDGMCGKLDATGGLLLEFFGNVSLDQAARRIVEFCRFLHRLPRDHGQKHGKNRHKKDGVSPPKRELIAAADAHDAECYEKVRAMPGASERQQLAKLPELLSIRMTQTNLERHLDRIHDILRAAATSLGYSGDTRVLTYSALAQEMATFSQELRMQEPLFLRMTRPKTRSRWSGIRLKKLLTSPIYRGCFSQNRRTRSGKKIIRDAIYWVPLIIMTMGTRLTEVLQLKAGDLIWHDDGVFCLRFAWTVEQDGKTKSSRRVVPIPQILLELGLVEWIKQKGFDADNLLFPEIFKRNPVHSDQTFTKRFWTIRKNLELLDHSEDFYALRMSLSSALWRAGVAESDRQIIIGHTSKTTIGQSYTSADMGKLKEMLDLADFKLKIFNSRVHGFPVIGDCGLISGAPANVEVILDAKGAVGAVRVTRESDKKQLAAACVSTSDALKLPGWKKPDRVSRERAAQAVHDLTSEFALIPPGNSAQAEAFEQFMAFGTSPSD